MPEGLSAAEVGKEIAEHKKHAASAARTKANRADLEGLVTRTFDSASFNAWFTAFTAATRTLSDWR
ncbi:MAG: hypothetical protein E6G05_14570 [Actinobacteria bacterium]|nr:MAG: hypothetical protein E6G05_14570 [Actinomycetota bacterium]